MNRRTLISLLLGFLFAFNADAQSRLKNGRYHERYGTTDITGTVVDHKYHGAFVWKEFVRFPEKLKPEWVITKMITYVNGVKNGLTVSFDQYGDTTEVGSFCNGQPCGHWRRKRDNRIVSICNYDSTGMEIGWQGYYNRQGVLIARDYFHSEKAYYSWKYNDYGKLLQRGDHSRHGREGTWYEYSDVMTDDPRDTLPTIISHWENGIELGLRQLFSKGVITEEWEVLNGQFYGKHKYYRNGRLRMEETRYNGALNGVRMEYADAGNIWVSQTYRNSVLHGEQLKYDTTTNVITERSVYDNNVIVKRELLTPKSQLIFREDLIAADSTHYRYAEYYTNGARKCEGEFVRGRPHGKYQSWYANGQREVSTWYKLGEHSQYMNIWNEDGVLVYSATVRSGIACDDEVVRDENGTKLARGTSQYTEQIKKYAPPGFHSFEEHGYTLPVVRIVTFNRYNRGIAKSTPESNVESCKSAAQPQFPGGDSAYHAFFHGNLVYPQMEKEAGIQGTTYVEFIVKSDGTISDIVVTKVLSPNISKEVLRVVTMMPKWIPAKKNGKSVDQKCVIGFRYEIL